MPLTVFEGAVRGTTARRPNPCSFCPRTLAASRSPCPPRTDRPQRQATPRRDPARDYRQEVVQTMRRRIAVIAVGVAALGAPGAAQGIPSDAPEHYVPYDQ